MARVRTDGLGTGPVGHGESEGGDQLATSGINLEFGLARIYGRIG